MRATTIRFTPELWELLEREAAQEGVSVAQYVCDAQGGGNAGGGQKGGPAA